MAIRFDMLPFSMELALFFRFLGRQLAGPLKRFRNPGIQCVGPISPGRGYDDIVLHGFSFHRLKHRRSSILEKHFAIFNLKTQIANVCLTKI